eukprot:4289368-Prorocentrum_lima.AAC.1
MNLLRSAVRSHHSTACSDNTACANRQPPRFTPPDLIPPRCGAITTATCAAPLTRAHGPFSPRAPHHTSPGPGSRLGRFRLHA